VSTELVLIPDTGELIDPHTAPVDQLAPLVLGLRDRERQLADTRKHIEHALLGRMEANGQRVLHTASGHTLELHSGRSRVWDPDDLEAAVRELVDHGVINPGQYTGLIRHDIKVDGNIAKRLLGALTGTAKRTLEACFRWQDGTPSLKVTPPVPVAIDATAIEDHTPTTQLEEPTW
jgi:hypothetical protein